MANRPVVFLDRDGTINEERGYLHRLDDLVLLPRAADALCALNSTGIASIVVTNQSGPARGYYTEDHVQNLHRRLRWLLNQSGAKVDAVYFCPHHVEGVVREYAVACPCRKPAPGLIERAFQEYADLDRKRAYMIGDMAIDIELARNAGIKSVLVLTGHGQSVANGRLQGAFAPDYTAIDLLDAVSWILSDLVVESYE